VQGPRPQAQPDPPEHRCADRVAVAFDVDGTLFDSEPEGHRLAFNAAFAELGVDVRWDLDTYASLLAVPGGRRRIEHYLICRGTPLPEARDIAARVHARKTELFVELALAGRIPTRPGVERLVRQLLAAGVELHVVTTGNAKWVRPLLGAAFGAGTFDIVITAEDVLELKPSPEAYLHMLAGTGLDRSHVVAIEDSAVGLASARAAGLACLVVRDSYAGHGPFPGAGLICAGFDELTAGIVLDVVPCQARRPAAVPPEFERTLIPARRDGELDEL
jgi:HAD superfamily hydrolase (TIGR01509 family)